MVFRIGHVSAIYFYMIALSGWQLKIVMSRVVTIRYTHDTIRIAILGSRYDTYRDTC